MTWWPLGPLAVLSRLERQLTPSGSPKAGWWQRRSCSEPGEGHCPMPSPSLAPCQALGRETRVRWPRCERKRPRCAGTLWMASQQGSGD